MKRILARCIAALSCRAAAQTPPAAPASPQSDVLRKKGDEPAEIKMGDRVEIEDKIRPR